MHNYTLSNGFKRYFVGAHSTPSWTLFHFSILAHKYYQNTLIR